MTLIEEPKVDNISIELPIYFYFEDANSYYKYTSLEVFLDSLSLSRPSEINPSHFKDTINKLIFLFKNVCTIDVLNNFYMIFDSDASVIEERKKILRMLATLDKENVDATFPLLEAELPRVAQFPSDKVI